jgi:predicted NAD/FAD-binding protein
MDELIEPLCVSALNLPAAQASAQVFLRVMRDALFGTGFGGWAASSLLLPRTDLSALLPNAAAQWLQTQHGGSTQLRLGTRVLGLQALASGWLLQGSGWQERFDRVVWATAAGGATRGVGVRDPRSTVLVAVGRDKFLASLFARRGMGGGAPWVWAGREEQAHERRVR